MKNLRELRECGGIIHDAISTLNGISGLLSILKEKLEDRPDKYVDEVEYLQIAHEGANGLIHRFQQMLTINALEEEAEISKEKINLFSFTEKIILTFNSEFDKKIKFIRRPISGTSQFDLFGNYGLISRAVSNLLRNAAEEIMEKEFPEENRVVILEFGAPIKDDGEVIIAVSNKSDIQDDTVAKIFNKKFSTKKNGYGLGTQVVQAVAQAHKGSAFAKKEGELIKIGIKIPN